jgi:hypothetical protein
MKANTREDIRDNKKEDGYQNPILHAPSRVLIPSIIFIIAVAVVGIIRGCDGLPH